MMPETLEDRLKSSHTLSPLNGRVLDNPWLWGEHAAYTLTMADLAEDATCVKLMADGWAGPDDRIERFRDRARVLQDVLRQREAGPPSPALRRELAPLVEVQPLPEQGRQVHHHRDAISLVALIQLEKAGSSGGSELSFPVQRVCRGCGGFCRLCGGVIPIEHSTGRRVRQDRRFCCGSCRKRPQWSQP